MRTFAVTLCLFLGLGSVCSGQKLWKGTRFGMTAAELKKLFGARLQPSAGDSEPGEYQALPAFTLRENFCGAAFDVAFVFVPGKPSARLVGVLLNGPTAGGRNARSCIVRTYTSAYGQPATRENDDGSVEHTFSRGNTIVFMTVGSGDEVHIAYDVREVYVEPPVLRPLLSTRTR
ncbi:MAG TPA: hypothetical protein VFL57_13400 [Bryobacteraceae bacterium]|nr:hypothetical protein [Bryobacteraceae bacterium]